METLAAMLFCLSAFAAGDYTISGTVVDQMTNRPINGVLVEMIQLGPDGGGEEASAVAPGTPVELTVHVQARESLATLKGMAMQDEKAIAGATVLLLPQDLSKARMFRRGQSDADGSFFITAVQAGNYTLLAVDDDEDFADRDERVIKPFLVSGVAITVPLKTDDGIKVPVQSREH